MGDRAVARAASAPGGGAADRGFELCSTHVFHRGFSSIFAVFHVLCHNRIMTCPSPTKSRDFGDLKKDAVFRSEYSYMFVCTWVM